MASVLKELDDADKIAEYKEKIRNLSDKLKNKTRALPQARAKKGAKSCHVLKKLSNRGKQRQL